MDKKRQVIVKCEKCNNKQNGVIYEGVLTIYPCPICLDNAYSNGNYKGWDDGYTSGRDDGYLDGLYAGQLSNT